MKNYHNSNNNVMYAGTIQYSLCPCSSERYNSGVVIRSLASLNFKWRGLCPRALLLSMEKQENLLAEGI